MINDQQSNVFVIGGDDANTQWIERMLGGDCYLVHWFPTILSFLEQFDPILPGCILADFHEPEGAAWDLVDVTQAEPPGIQLIFLADSIHVSTAVELMKAGVSDVMVRPLTEDASRHSIERATAIDSQQKHDYVAKSTIRRHYTMLTPREREVFQLVVSGLPSKGIARVLDRSQKTVEVHRTSIMKKMAAKSVVDLVRMGIELHGLDGGVSSDRKAPVAAMGLNDDLGLTQPRAFRFEPNAEPATFVPFINSSHPHYGYWQMPQLRFACRACEVSCPLAFRLPYLLLRDQEAATDREEIAWESACEGGRRMLYWFVVGCLSVQAVTLIAVIWYARKAGEASTALGRSFGQNLQDGLERLDRNTREEMARNRSEVADSLSSSTGALSASMHALSQNQKSELETLARQLSQQADSNERRLETLRVTVEDRLRLLSEENSRKLEQMRQTVDEKLQSTLEQRLGESFKQVSDRLEVVHRGLGEMQTLAVGVGDLKKVLTNVKTRGTLAEIQLGSLLEQILPPDQFVQNAETRSGSNQRVEFAVRLPGRDGQVGGLLLPIDAKFPLEDYQRLIDAQEKADVQAAELAAKKLEDCIKSAAKKIRDGYLAPPATTDFAIMYLGTEGLYAEVLRRPGLFETLQRDYRVTPAGPTTLCAILNSLQMGFRTLAIQKRAGEVWQVLGAVKAEFGRFGDLLDSVQKKLNEAQNKIEDAARKSRTIERKLGGVETPHTLGEKSADVPGPAAIEPSLPHLLELPS